MPENLVRETGSAVPSRVSLLISILRPIMLLTYGIPPKFRGGVHLMKPPYVIGSIPSLSGHAIVYRWRSLPRVRRHRVRKPQGSSERLLPWQVTMDQLICASLSHTHYWYEVGMHVESTTEPYKNRGLGKQLLRCRGEHPLVYCTIPLITMQGYHINTEDTGS